MRGRCKEEAGVQIKPSRVTGTEDSVRLELGTRRMGSEILPPLVYMGEPGHNIAPTQMRGPASVERVNRQMASREQTKTST